MHHEKSQCTAEALSQILDLELLCPEREIFEICMQWSAAMAVAATDASTLRSLLGTSVQKIRFTSMTNEEFSEIVVKYPGFFLPSEALEIFLAISKESAKGAKETANGFYAVDKIHSRRTAPNGKV